MMSRSPLAAFVAPFSLLLLLLFLAACGRQPQVERIELGEADGPIALTPSPDSTGAHWMVSADGKAIEFGKLPDAPYLTLACALSKTEPARLTVIRHALSEPGAKALFALMGNGIISRLDLDAALGPDGWRWEGSFPAAAPELEVFTGPRDVEATLPGAGTVKIAGSGMPREFIDWCRREGRTAPVPDTGSALPPA